MNENLKNVYSLRALTPVEVQVIINTVLHTGQVDELYEVYDTADLFFMYVFGKEPPVFEELAQTIVALAEKQECADEAKILYARWKIHPGNMD
jgi:hypothetical protein